MSEWTQLTLPPEFMHAWEQLEAALDLLPETEVSEQERDTGRGDPPDQSQEQLF